MKAIVGLGNPGERYQNTRHNLGFRVLDLIAQESTQAWQTKFNCNFMAFQLEGLPCILVKPLKFMNLSGETLNPLLSYFKISVEDTIVIYDDLDLDPGVIRIRLGGSTGTHNGVKDLVRCLPSADFIRLRLGIGHPRSVEGCRLDVSDWVLSQPSASEKPLIDSAVLTAKEAVKEILSQGLEFAQRKYNPVSKQTLD